MAENKQERRQDVRVTFRSLARLQFSGGRLFNKCETGDISVSGVFVEGVGGVECGERCALEFQLIGRTSTLVLEMSAEVVRIVDDGVALQFVQVDQDSFCHLQNIVYFNYQQAGQLGGGYEEAPVGVADETLYLGLAASLGKSGDDELDEYGEGEDSDDDLDPEVSAQLSYVGDED